MDVAGVGIGPFNLSLAAQLRSAPELRARFFDARPEFGWHEGLMFKHATLQSPYLKDCVTLVDPTSPYTFLNYLVRTRRIHRFLVADYPNVPRQEYDRYFRWVSRQLDTLRFGSRVDEIGIGPEGFALRAGRQRLSARHLVLGVGHRPNIPEAVEPHLGPTVFHGGEFLTRRVPYADRSVVVIGGGQTGAEIFHELISDRHAPPARVTWATRRFNFVPFDESPFANELYVPGYTRVFYGQPAAERERLLERQKYSSDAILEPLLLAIYRRLYEADYLEDGSLSYRLLVDREVADLQPDGSGWTVTTQGPTAKESTYADIVVVATGYRPEAPEFLGPLTERIEFDEQGRFAVEEDFSLRWDGAPAHRIYAHNAALHTHGWIDPNFAGMAWRSAVITNSLAGREVYDLSGRDTTVDWAGGDDGSVPDRPPADEY